MKKRIVMLAAALVLLLIGCQAEEPAGTASVPLEPSPTAGVPESTPPETPSPEQLLAQQPIDDDHDAFLVDTGGKLGTLLVTAERGEQDPESWFLGYKTTLSVWDPQDMGVPIQTMTVLVEHVAFGHHEVVDANFDGYMDLSYMYFVGNQPNYWYLWVWDEEAGQFVEVPEYQEISGPHCNPETEVIDGFARSSGAGDGTTTFHRWEDGELVCIRRIEMWWEPDEGIMTEEEITVFPMHITVEDRVDGELSEVYAGVVAPGEDYLSERAKWENLDYHGEN